MSNRRRLSSEKGAKTRCPKCRSREFVTKSCGYDVHVCERCQHTWPTSDTTPGAAS